MLFIEAPHFVINTIDIPRDFSELWKIVGLLAQSRHYNISIRFFAATKLECLRETACKADAIEVRYSFNKGEYALPSARDLHNGLL